MSFTVPTSLRVEVKDITREVVAEVEKSKVKNGIVLVYVPHSTAALFINENESGLVKDLTWMVEEIIPKGRSFEHNRIDNNAWSHLVSALLGCSLTLPVTGGRIERGTWQNIFLVELDGPRNRKVAVKVIGA